MFYYFVMHIAALNYCVFMTFSLSFVLCLLILCNFVTYCFDLNAKCSLPLLMTNSTFNPTCADDGSVNVYVYVCMHVVGTQYPSHKYQYSSDRIYHTEQHTTLETHLFLLFTATCSQRLLDPRVVCSQIFACSEAHITQPALDGLWCAPHMVAAGLIHRNPWNNGNTVRCSAYLYGRPQRYSQWWTTTNHKLLAWSLKICMICAEDSRKSLAGVLEPLRKAGCK